MDVIIHYPKSIRGWHTLARHAVAVSELIGLERQGISDPLNQQFNDKSNPIVYDELQKNKWRDYYEFERSVPFSE